MVSFSYLQFQFLNAIIIHSIYRILDQCYLRLIKLTSKCFERASQITESLHQPWIEPLCQQYWPVKFGWNLLVGWESAWYDMIRQVGSVSLLYICSIIITETVQPCPPSKQSTTTSTTQHHHCCCLPLTDHWSRPLSMATVQFLSEPLNAPRTSLPFYASFEIDLGMLLEDFIFSWMSDNFLQKVVFEIGLFFCIMHVNVLRGISFVEERMSNEITNMPHF